MIDDLQKVEITVTGLGVEAQYVLVISTQEFSQSYLDHRTILRVSLQNRLTEVFEAWLEEVPMPTPPAPQPPRHPVKDFFNRIYLWLARFGQSA